MKRMKWVPMIKVVIVDGQPVPFVFGQMRVLIAHFLATRGPYKVYRFKDWKQG